ncbi:hypothetical protein BT69DRAFT_1185899, partial [Atractiella rhizophila]
AQELLRIIFKAIDGSLGLRTYTTKHFRLGAMLLRIGGARLVHTFHRANGLPSLRAIRRFVSHHKLHGSYGYPTAHEILHNLGIFPYSDEASANHAFFYLAKDETALEKRCCYNPFTNRCEGLCREHVGDLDLVIDGEEKVFEIGVKLRQGLDDIAGGAHIASFVSVGGLGRFGDKEYHMKPMSISPTCMKGGSFEDGIQTMATEEKATLEFIAQRFGGFGHLLAYCSDGDGKRRKEFQFWFRKKEIHQVFPQLFKVIRNDLPLFDYFTSKTGILPVFDVKHLWKRFATALRRKGGIAVAHVTTTPEVTRKHLKNAHPNVDDYEWYILYYEKDKMNVPRTTRLLTYFSQLANIPKPYDDSLTTFHEWRALSLLSSIIRDTFIPFISMNMDLSTQLENLATAALKMLVCYRVNGGNFLPWQLYHDFVTTVKAAFLIVARIKATNPQFRFFLFQLGTDLLEQAFGIIRTLKGGDRNFDFHQFQQRAVAACEIQHDYVLHPEWRPTDKRLDPATEHGQDHLNPSSVTGCVEVGKVDLDQVWEAALWRTERELK